MRVRCFKGKDGKCVQCGVPLPSHFYRTCKAGTHPQKSDVGYKTFVRKPPSPSPPSTKRYAGDYLKLTLDALGISQRHYKVIKKKLGAPPTCGCAARQQWLNDVDKLVRERSGNIARKAINWIRRVLGHFAGTAGTIRQSASRNR